MLSNKIEKYFNLKRKEIISIVDLDKLNKYNVDVVKYDDKLHNGNIIELSDKNNHSNRFLSTYFIAGYYNIITSTWIWAWANPYLEKNLADKLKNKIKDNSLIGQIRKDVNKKELYNYFSTEDTFFISNKNIDELMKFILFVSNGLWFVSRKINDNSLEILIIDKIIQNK